MQAIKEARGFSLFGIRRKEAETGEQQAKYAIGHILSLKPLIALRDRDIRVQDGPGGEEVVILKRRVWEDDDLIVLTASGVSWSKVRWDGGKMVKQPAPAIELGAGVVGYYYHMVRANPTAIAAAEYTARLATDIGNHMEDYTVLWNKQ